MTTTPRTVHGSLTFTITERSADRTVSEMPIAAGLLNPFGVVNAGAILWLADVTATVLVFGPGEPAAGAAGFPLSIQLSASLLANQGEGLFRATATWVRRGRTVSVVRTLVHGANDRLIADVTTSHVLSR